MRTVGPAAVVRRVVVLAVTALGGLAACGKGKPARPPVTVHAQRGDLALVGATVVPMASEGALTGHIVLIRGERIVAVAPAATVDTTGASVVDVTGQWILPGLADMHVHIQGEHDLPLFVLNGVTTVRNLFGSPEHLRWRDATATGALLGPTIYTSGPIVDGDPPVWPGSAVVTTAEAARAEVVAEKKAGYDWIKVYGGLPRAAYDAVLAEAKAQGMPVAGHVPKDVGLAGVLAAAGGQRSIEHLDGYVTADGAPPAPALTAQTVAAGIWNCPTLVVHDRFGKLDAPEQLAGTRGLELVTPVIRAAWDPRNDFRLARWTPDKFAAQRRGNQARKELVGALARAGARLVLGTDTGNPYVIPGFAVDDELALLVGAGLTPWQALRTATVAAAELEGTPGAFGVVAAGARADLLVVTRDPLADIANIVDPSMVIVRGYLHHRAELVAAAQLPEPPADPFATLPEVEAEGTPVASARYQVLMAGQPIGVERAVLSRLADGSPVVRGQVAYSAPQQMRYTYRASRDALDLTTDALSPPHVLVTRRGDAVEAVQDGQPPVTLSAAGAVIAPQTVAEFLWYVPLLADLSVGATRTVTAAEVVTDGRLAVVPGRFAFTRTADDGGRRAYTIDGTHGALALTGRLIVGADSAPDEVTVTVKFGTFTTRRVAPPTPAP